MSGRRGMLRFVDRKGGDQEPLGPAISYYVDVIRRRWWFAIVGGLVGLAVAAGLLQLSDRTATATTVVQLSIVASDPLAVDRPPSTLLDFPTEQQVGRSFLVAERSAELLENRVSPREVRAASEVAVGGQGSVALIRYTASDGELAVLGADAVAAAYMEVRAAQAIDRINDQRAALQERLTQLQGDYSGLQSQRGSVADPIVAARELLLTQEMQQVVQRLATLGSVPTTGGRVLSPAGFSELVYSPSTRTALVMGLLAGLLTGLAAAFVIQRGSRIDDPVEIGTSLAAPVWELKDYPASDTWRLVAQCVLLSIPPQAREVTLALLASAESVDSARAACVEALEADGRMHAGVKTLALTADPAATELMRLRHAEALVVVIDRGYTYPARLASVTATLRAVDATPCSIVWLHPREKR